MQSRASIGVVALLLAAALLMPPPAAALALVEGLYGRAAIGHDKTQGTRFRDRDCASQNPPALFGCQQGVDGRAIGGRGDFGRGTSVELAMGYRHNPWLRGEVAVARQTGLGFDGSANFLGVAGIQPVAGNARSTQVMVLGLVDLPPLPLALPFSLQPFVGAGLGASRNSTSTLTYGFPGLGEGAATLVPGTNTRDIAWQLRTGLGANLTERLAMELVLVYSDLGSIETGRGEATIRRQSGDRLLTIDSTEATLRSRGWRLGLRYHF